MSQLNLVLVEPRIAGNTGNVARTCAATGARLHLVEPLGFRLEDRLLKRAGLDYWPYLDVTLYPSLEEFLRQHREDPLFFFTTKGRQVYSAASYPDGAYLVFGREDKGLPEPLLAAHPGRCLRLPMRPGLRSLNLANTVAVAAYEVLRQWDFPQLSCSGELRSFDWTAARSAHPDSEFL